MKSLGWVKSSRYGKISPNHVTHLRWKQVCFAQTLNILMDSHLNHPSVPVPLTPEIDPEQRAKIFAALADPTRLRIVELLAVADELSGSEIANQLGISLALFCHHSKILIEAGLVDARKEGQTKFSSLNRALLAACFASFDRLIH